MLPWMWQMHRKLCQMLTFRHIWRNHKTVLTTKWFLQVVHVWCTLLTLFHNLELFQEIHTCKKKKTNMVALLKLQHWTVQIFRKGCFRKCPWMTRAGSTQHLSLQHVLSEFSLAGTHILVGEDGSNPKKNNSCGVIVEIKVHYLR